jgi:hypothetical protein
LFFVFNKKNEKKKEKREKKRKEKKQIRNFATHHHTDKNF